MPGLLDYNPQGGPGDVNSVPMPGTGAIPNDPNQPAAVPGVVPSSAGPEITAPQDKNSLLDRLLRGVLPVPHSLQGMLTPEETTENRRRALLNFGASMLRSSGPQNGMPAQGTAQAFGNAIGAGVGAYDQGVNTSLGQQDYARQRAQAAHILQIRQQAQDQFSIPPNATEQQQLQIQSAMGAFLARNGDYEGAKAIGEVTSPLRMSRAYGANNLQIKDTAGGYMGIDPATGKVTPIMGTDGKPLQSNAVTEADRAAGRGLQASGQDLSYMSHALPAFKPYADRAAVFTNDMALYDQLAAGNPAATHSLAGLVGSLEPMKPRLVGNMVQWLSNIDPSWGGKFQQWVQGGMTGTLPPEMLPHVGKFLATQYQADKDQVGRLFDGLDDKNHPKIKSIMQDYNPDTMFPDLPASLKNLAPTPAARRGAAPPVSAVNVPPPVPKIPDRLKQYVQP